MRIKLALLVALLCMVGCSSKPRPSSSPTDTAQRYLASLESGDLNGLMKLFSRRAIQDTGEGTVRERFQRFSDEVRRLKAEGVNLKADKIKETITGDDANVTLVYADREKDEVANLTFTFVNENGEWKIDETKLLE